MYAKFVQLGESIDYTPVAAVSAGDVVFVGSLACIAKLDIPAGQLGALATVGVYDIVKATGAIDKGAVVYWDATNNNVTTTSTDNTRIGIAIEAAASGDATARVLINA